MQSRKTLLFSEKLLWAKKQRDEDVPMRCCDDSEVCEIVGSCMLNLLSNILGKDFVSLYRDDSLYRDNS